MVKPRSETQVKGKWERQPAKVQVVLITAGCLLACAEITQLVSGNSAQITAQSEERRGKKKKRQNAVGVK